MKKKIMEFLIQKKAELKINSMKIFLVLPFYILAVLLFSLWIILKMRGEIFPWDRISELVPMALKITAIVTFASFIHMIWNQWDAYTKQKKSKIQKNKPIRMEIFFFALNFSLIWKAFIEVRFTLKK